MARQLVQEQPSARAAALLERCLSPAQLETYRSGQYFDAAGNITGTVYRVRCSSGISGNITALTGDHKDASFCIYPSRSSGSLPQADIWLAQKLYIEQDEERFLLVAHRISRYTYTGVNPYWPHYFMHIGEQGNINYYVRGIGW